MASAPQPHTYTHSYTYTHTKCPLPSRCVYFSVYAFYVTMRYALIYVFVSPHTGLLATNRQELYADTYPNAVTCRDFDICLLPGKLLKRAPLAGTVASSRRVPFRLHEHEITCSPSSSLAVSVYTISSIAQDACTPLPALRHLSVTEHTWKDIIFFPVSARLWGRAKARVASSCPQAWLCHTQPSCVSGTFFVGGLSTAAWQLGA